MDGTMRYDFGAIEGLQGDIGARVTAIETRIADLKAQIDNVTQIWEGSANEGFRATKAAWEQAATDMNQVLKQIQIAVMQTNTDAQATERQNASRWG
jgi:early secretory antigenic target protein ESAT-6